MVMVEKVEYQDGGIVLPMDQEITRAWISFNDIIDTRLPGLTTDDDCIHVDITRSALLGVVLAPTG